MHARDWRPSRCRGAERADIRSYVTGNPLNLTNYALVCYSERPLGPAETSGLIDIRSRRPSTASRAVGASTSGRLTTSATEPGATPALLDSANGFFPEGPGS